MPTKGILSNSFYLKQNGFFSMDYEFQNFGAIRHHFRQFEDMSEMVNKTVKNKYGFSHTLRLGAEGAIKWFRLRAGYAWQSSPFRKGVGARGFDEQRHLASAGLGYRGKNFFADVAYHVLLYNTYHQPYQSGDGFEPAVTTRHRLHNFLITVGWRFSRN
jgi:long-subunit fatty acid transport protein